MQKHTPGPWGELTLSDNGLTIGINYPDGDDRDHYLAEVTCGDPEELEANAALIQSAPELLEALKAMMAHYGYKDPAYDNEACVLARAAIAKATL